MTPLRHLLQGICHDFSRLRNDLLVQIRRFLRPSFVVRVLVVFSVSNLGEPCVDRPCSLAHSRLGHVLAVLSKHRRRCASPSRHRHHAEKDRCLKQHADNLVLGDYRILVRNEGHGELSMDQCIGRRDLHERIVTKYDFPPQHLCLIEVPSVGWVYRPTMKKGPHGPFLMRCP